MVYRSNIYYSEIYQRGNWKNNSSSLHLEVWTRYFRHRYSVKLSRTSMDLKIIKPHIARKGIMLYWLNLKNNSNQRLCLFRQKQILRSSRHKNLQNQNNEVFFRKYNTIYRIKCNADNKTQSFQMWPKPFIKSFTSSSGSSLQIN